MELHAFMGNCYRASISHRSDSIHADVGCTKTPLSQLLTDGPEWENSLNASHTTFEQHIIKIRKRLLRRRPDYLRLAIRPSQRMRRLRIVLRRGASALSFPVRTIHFELRFLTLVCQNLSDIANCTSRVKQSIIARSGSMIRRILSTTNPVRTSYLS
jgi:hypothetical protein